MANPNGKNTANTNLKGTAKPNEKNTQKPNEKNASKPKEKHVAKPKEKNVAKANENGNSQANSKSVTKQNGNNNGVKLNGKNTPKPNENNAKPNGKNVASPNANNAKPNGKNVASPNENNAKPNGKSVASPNANNAKPNGKNVASPNENNAKPNGKSVASPNENNAKPNGTNIASPNESKVPNSNEKKEAQPPKNGPSTVAPGASAANNDKFNSARVMLQQLSLLKKPTTADQLSELNTAPLFSYPVLDRARKLATPNSTQPFSQYALLAGDARCIRGESFADPRIYYNVSTPSSVFICGSQGSGKSHTLSCILENCLIQSERLGCLPRPLTGIVFHYDNYASDSHVAPCEAAYLGSDPAIKVRVLCAPTNLMAIKNSYQALGNVTVEALRLDQGDLNTKRMLELMAFDNGSQPLYVQVIQRILREMRLEQQDRPCPFNYRKFAQTLKAEKLMGEQQRALGQRLDTLESFMVPNQVNHNSANGVTGTNWTPKAGELIIVDLTCPCVTAPTACALFNICLSIFLEQDSSFGRVIALDEAHRYMGESSESNIFTDSLLAAIRFQRHLGARIVISTQEPTISPKLLDLCSITIVHRFSSPDWLSMLTKHLAGISKVARATNVADQDGFDENDEANSSGLRGIAVPTEDPIMHLFSQIVELHTGEALVFAPNAIMSLKEQKPAGRNNEITPKKLAHNVLWVVMRSRITTDGGRSIMAS